MVALAVSVVVPCYNQAIFLGEALQSVVSQEFTDWECIIVNDGSTDDTEAMAVEWAERDSRIKYVSRQNGGLPSARNTGIEHSNGKYLLFLDSDDCIHPRMLSELVQVAENSDADIAVCGWMRFVSNPVSDWYRCTPPNSFKFPARTWVQENPIPVHAAIVRASAVRNVGGLDESLTACEDWDLWLRLALNGATVVSHPQIFAFYRANPGSMSSERQRMLENRIAVLRNAHGVIFQDGEMVQRFGTEVLQVCARLTKRVFTLPRENRGNLLEVIDSIAVCYSRTGCTGARWSLLRKAALVLARISLLRFRALRGPQFATMEKGFM